MKYTLDDKGQPVAEPDLMKWAKWFEVADRKVGSTIIGEVRVSTVFVGIDHVCWETMVFGGKLDQEQDRCSGSREQAESMHTRMAERVRLEQEKGS